MLPNNMYSIILDVLKYVIFMNKIFFKDLREHANIYVYTQISINKHSYFV